MDGIERDEDTESRIEDHKSCGGASGVEARESSIVLKVERHRKTIRIPTSSRRAYTLLTIITISTTNDPSEVQAVGHPSLSELSYLNTLMAEAVAVPEHKLYESPNSRSIEIFGWSITASTYPISSASDCAALQGSLGFPLPEMTFGSNILTLEHRPSGWKYSFTTEAALKAVKNGELQEGDGGVKVEYADKWMESRYVGFSQTALLDAHSLIGRDLPRLFPCLRQCLRSLMTGHIQRHILDMIMTRHLPVARRSCGAPQSPITRHIAYRWLNLHVRILFFSMQRFLCLKMNYMITVLLMFS